MPPKLLSHLPSGLRDRTWVTAKLAARLGVAAAKKNLGIGDGAPDDEDEADAVARAEELVKQMGALKGLVMKVGQMASYLPGAMPPAAQKILSELQASTVAMEPEVIEREIERELGKKPAELFDEFDRAPFAAASIGQVHRARLGERQIVVKVQYPGIEEVLTSDLKTAGTLATLSSMGSKVKGGELASELRQRLLEECDYRIEARNQRVFGEVLGRIRGARVPEVVPERSARRVLSSALAEGQRFGAFVAGASQPERDAAGALVYEGCFRPLFQHGLFNADPHPGNYLFAADGGVVFLDFGCARTFDAAFIDRWKALALCVTDSDRARFPERLAAVGFVSPGDKRFDFDAQWAAMGVLYRPMRDPAFRFTREFVRETYDALVFKNVNKLRLAMPPEWLFLNRLQWGIFAILAELGAGPGVHRLWREVIESKTEPVTLA
ncbi:MAG: AarF/ABC1/UbiB kinase family protein [Polyangiaceae bacterium]|nr:AarF/ABC1/UbiB kinase family protein [Polyangiaceae bacterium]